MRNNVIYSLGLLMKIWRKLLFIFIFLSSGKQLEAWVDFNTVGVAVTGVVNNWAAIAAGGTLMYRYFNNNYQMIKLMKNLSDRLDTIRSQADEDNKSIVETLSNDIIAERKKFGEQVMLVGTHLENKCRSLLIQEREFYERRVTEVHEFHERRVTEVHEFHEHQYRYLVKGCQKWQKEVNDAIIERFLEMENATGKIMISAFSLMKKQNEDLGTNYGRKFKEELKSLLTQFKEIDNTILKKAMAKCQIKTTDLAKELTKYESIKSNGDSERLSYHSSGFGENSELEILITDLAASYKPVKFSRDSGSLSSPEPSGESLKLETILGNIKHRSNTGGVGSEDRLDPTDPLLKMD